MKFEDIKEVLNHQDTIFTEQGGYNIAVNTTKGKYVREANNVYSIGDLKTNDISSLEKQNPIELYNVQQVGEILGMTRMGIRWNLDNKDFSKVPKPRYVNETKRGKTYFWVPEQFENRTIE